MEFELPHLEKIIVLFLKLTGEEFLLADFFDVISAEMKGRGQKVGVCKNKKRKMKGKHRRNEREEVKRSVFVRTKRGK